MNEPLKEVLALQEEINKLSSYISFQDDIISHLINESNAAEIIFKVCSDKYTDKETCIDFISHLITLATEGRL